MIKKDILYSALRHMGKKYIKEPYKSHWTPDCPVLGYCYVVSEVLSHRMGSDKVMPYRIKISDTESHWFLKAQNGDVIDLTADQYDYKLPYNTAKKASFLTKSLSKRGQVLEQYIKEEQEKRLPPLT